MSGPTHDKGHTLDLVLSSGLNILNTETFMIGVSDHRMIVFEALLPPPPPTPSPSHHLTRSINPMTATHFSDTLMRSYSSTISNIITAPTNTENLVSLFQIVSSKTLDRVAPAKLVRCKPNMVVTPWLNETTRTLRRGCRQAERKWKLVKLQISYDILRNCLKTYQVSVKAAKSDYYANLINTHSNRPQVLFKTINSILNPAVSAATTPTPDLDTCEKFKNFFTDKITNIRALIPRTTPYHTVIHPPASTFQIFSPVSSSLLSEVVSHLKPTSCPSDIIPSRLLKDVFATISPLILAITNSSLQSGHVPSIFKHATIQPLLKKPSLDPNDHNNYRPISKLPFLSKVLEKIVFTQISAYLHSFTILDKFQSGFRTLHSTESALLKVNNDILRTVDDGSCAILVLLDLSAAFDTINHCTLLTRLEEEVGLKGSVLEWFRSYLQDRTFSVQIGSCSSSSAPITWRHPSRIDFRSSNVLIIHAPTWHHLQ